MIWLEFEACKISKQVLVLLLTEEILHHLGCKKSVNHGMSYLSSGAGFLPSTVSMPFILN